MATTVSGGQYGFSVLVGDSSTNILNAYDYFNTIITGGGAETVNAGAGDATVDGNGPANLSVFFNGYFDSVQAAPGSDTILGSQGLATISLMAGSDFIVASGYENQISVGAGNSSIDAGDGLSSVSVGDGNSSILVGGYFDSVYGGNGSNLVSGPEGYASVSLGTGSDTVMLSGYNDTISLGDGNNTIEFPDGSASIVTGNGNNSILAGGYADFISVGGGNNTIAGPAGLATIVAGAGNNVMDLTGYENQVSLTGGSATVDPGSGLDTISITGTALTVAGGTNASVFVSAAPGSAITDNGTGTQFTISAGAGPVTINPSTDSAWSFDILTPGNGELTSADLTAPGNLSTSNGATNLDLHNGTTIVFEGMTTAQVQAYQFKTN